MAVPASWFSDRATYCVILSIVNVQSAQMCRPVRTRARRGVPVNGFPLGGGGTALEGPEALGMAPCVREVSWPVSYAPIGRLLVVLVAVAPQPCARPGNL